MSTRWNLVEDHIPEAREPAGYRRPDSDINGELGRRLAEDADLDASGVGIEVREGEVTLSGNVPDCSVMQRVEAHACAIAGVATVRNRLRSGQPPAALPDGTLGEAVGSAARMGNPMFER